MSQSTASPVRRTVIVPLPAERAFYTFVNHMGLWWPRQNTFGKEKYHTVLVEPVVGGRWYERSADGEETAWGTVLAYEPPHRIILTWQITAQGTPEADPARASEIEIRFMPLKPSSTSVELEHREFGRHGDEDGAIWREGMESEDAGWTNLLKHFARLCTAENEQKPG